MLKKVLAAVGVGSASINAILDSSHVIPGGELAGTIHMEGGSTEQTIRGIEIRVETHYKEKSGDHTYTRECTIASYRTPDAVTLHPGDHYETQFAIVVPHSTPLTLGSQRVWVRTSLDIEMALDPKDRDAIQVSPTPLQHRILDAMSHLGFEAVRAECEKSFHGRDVPFVQEIEMKPYSGPFRGHLDEVDVVMLPYRGGIDLVLEVDRKARGLTSWLAEVTDLDESRFRLRFNESDLHRPLNEWIANIERTIAAGA